MGKNKDGRRSTKKNRRKNTLKRMGKNNKRSVRIKELNKIRTTKKGESNNYLVDFHSKCSENKGKMGGANYKICVITCNK